MEATLVRTLRHTTPVCSLAVMPDGSEVITGTRDNLVCQWAVADGQLLKTCRGHIPPHQISAVACSQDSQQFASGGRDCFICVWDKTGKQLTTLKKGHRAYVTSLSYANDHRYLVSGAADGKIQVWNPATNRILKTLEPAHAGPVTCVAVSGDSKYIVSGGDDKMMNVWKPEDVVSYGTRCAGKLYRAIQGHEAEVTGVAITSDNSHVMSGSLDKKVRVHMVLNRKLVRTLTHDAGVQCMALSKDDKWLATGTTLGGIYIWRLQTGEQVAHWKAHDAKVRAIAITDKGIIVSAGNDNFAKVWQVPLIDATPAAAAPEAAPKPAADIQTVTLSATGSIVPVADPGAWPEKPKKAAKKPEQPAKEPKNTAKEPKEPANEPQEQMMKKKKKRQAQKAEEDEQTPSKKKVTFQNPPVADQAEAKRPPVAEAEAAPAAKKRKKSKKGAAPAQA
mmetsp:Transcript_97386/g.167889  ORF Transcript_97386/g.167889 Transcript_97386/m.167889 type:complete len:448 (-) Transcript_97386:242-1585(-)